MPIAATIAVATKGPIPGHLPESLAGWIGRGDLFNLFVHRDDLLLQVFPLAPQQADEVTHAWCQVRICVLEDLRHRLLQLERSLGEDHATLEQEGPQLVDYGRSTGDKPVAHTMHRLEIKLVVRLDRIGTVQREDLQRLDDDIDILKAYLNPRAHQGALSPRSKP